MRTWISLSGIVAALALFAGVAQAKDNWHQVAELIARGDAKEVAVGREAKAVRITNVAGTVTINTVVVRNGAAKTSHTVAAKIPEKQSVEIALGAKQMVTGLRISDAAGGTYRVYVK